MGLPEHFGRTDCQDWNGIIWNDLTCFNRLSFITVTDWQSSQYNLKRHWTGPGQNKSFTKEHKLSHTLYPRLRHRRIFFRRFSFYLDISKELVFLFKRVWVVCFRISKCVKNDFRVSLKHRYIFKFLFLTEFGAIHEA